MEVGIIGSFCPPNKLLVDFTSIDMEDPSGVWINPKKLDDLDLLAADVVVLVGRQRSRTLAVVYADERVPEGSIHIHRVTRKNLRVRTQDCIRLLPGDDIPHLTQLDIRPFADSIEGLAGDLAASFIIPYFKDQMRPLHKGDLITIDGDFRSVDFKVVETEPQEFGIVGPDTELFFQGEPYDRA